MPSDYFTIDWRIKRVVNQLPIVQVKSRNGFTLADGQKLVSNPDLVFVVAPELLRSSANCHSRKASPWIGPPEASCSWTTMRPHRR